MGPDGFQIGCSLEAVSDGAGTYSGVLQGGPSFVGDVVDGAGLAEDPGLAHGDMWCAIQVNDPISHDGYGPYAYQAISDYGVGALAIPPRQVSFTATETDDVFMCNGFWIRLPDGSYIHTNNDADESTSEAECAIALNQGGVVSVKPDVGPFLDHKYEIEDGDDW
jgi:hypothetical protein